MNMTYEQWDAIADSYNPALFAFYIVWSIIYFRSGDRAAPLKGFIGIVICYLIMFADNVLEIWKSFSLDYSTHSAVAFALVYFHIHKRKPQSPAAIAFLVSLALYIALMLYQRYHSLPDILSTLFIVAPLVIGAYRIRFAGSVLQRRNHS